MDPNRVQPSNCQCKRRASTLLRGSGFRIGLFGRCSRTVLSITAGRVVSRFVAVSGDRVTPVDVPAGAGGVPLCISGRLPRSDHEDPAIHDADVYPAELQRVLDTLYLQAGNDRRAFAGESDGVMAAAMIDRLVHDAAALTLKGDSYRLKDRDLGRVPPATTTKQTLGEGPLSPDEKGSRFSPRLTGVVD